MSLSNCLLSQGHGRLVGWYPLISGTNVNFTSIGFCNENTGYVVGSGDVRKTTDGGLNWENVSEAAPFYIRSVSFPAVDSVYLYGYSGNDDVSMVTYNGGQNWYITVNLIGIDIMKSYFINARTGFISGFIYVHTLVIGMLYKTNNASVSFYPVINIGLMGPYAADINFPVPDTGYAIGFQSSIFKSVNNGNNWSQVSAISGRTAIDLCFINGTTGFVSADTGYLFKTTTGGLSWETVPSQVNANLNCIYFSNSRNGYIGSANGRIINTTDGGETWFLHQNLPTDVKKILFVNDSVGYLIGSAGRIYKTTDGGGILAIGGKGKVLNSFWLYQNYPNPFNPSTTIKLDLPKSSDVNLMICDMLGREIYTIASQYFTAGSYSFTWDARGYSSGIYFYRLTATDTQSNQVYTDTKKMILLK